MYKHSDKQQLKLIQDSLYDPKLEEEAKKLLLRDIYEEVSSSYTGYASNGGKLAPLPECVKQTLCYDDTRFSYNAIRVLMARYLSRDEKGRYTETPSMVMKRVALGLSQNVDAERLYKLLVDGKFLFNSPTLFNMYVNGSRGTLSACYVTPIYDDMYSIMDTAVVQAMTFKWGGGQGFSFSELRPRWDIVKGTGSYSSGPLSFIHIYDAVTESVKQGGKRRGANMGIMHIWHPDIITPGFDPWVALRNKLPPQVRNIIDVFRELISELYSEGYEVSQEIRELVEKLSRDGTWSVEDAGFIQAKKPPLQDANLTNFNISVAVNDYFMEAVVGDKDWWMVNPRLSREGENGIYKIHYTISRSTGLGRIGELIEKQPWLLKNPYLGIYEDILEDSLNYARKILVEHGYSSDTKNPIAWKYPARRIWREIIENAWGGGDPGVVYPDNHNKWNPTPWLGVATTTNPCSEQWLYPFESCNLGSISIDKYISDGIFHLDEFMKDVELAVDSLDSIIDVNKHPDPRHNKANQFTRKIGLGIMGLANALAKLEIPYDSDEAVAFTLIVMASLEVFAWKRSWELGAEKGHAPAFECKMYDWKKQSCLEETEPEELVELHTPALVKAGRVAKINNSYLELEYHRLEIPKEIINSLPQEFATRIEKNGKIKLVPRETLEKILREVFGISREIYWEALKTNPLQTANNPRYLLALAIWNPLACWELLKTYGRMVGARAPRNTVTTTVAPTGTISIIAGTSSGIEPFFALVYKRRVAVGEFLEVVKPFRDKLLEIAKKYNLPRTILSKIYNIIARYKGSLRNALPELREELSQTNYRDILQELEELANKFPTSMDFPLWYHLAHQLASQLYVDQAISKTINLPKNAPIEQVEAIYLTAWLGGLKGITIYRDESKGQQVILFGGDNGATRQKILRKTKRDEKNKIRLEIPKKNGRRGTLVLDITQNSTCLTCER